MSVNLYVRVALYKRTRINAPWTRKQSKHISSCPSITCNVNGYIVTYYFLALYRPDCYRSSCAPTRHWRCRYENRYFLVHARTTFEWVIPPDRGFSILNLLKLSPYYIILKISWPQEIQNYTSN